MIERWRRDWIGLGEREERESARVETRERESRSARARESKREGARVERLIDRIGWKIQVSRDLAPSAIIGYRRRVHIKEHLNRW